MLKHIFLAATLSLIGTPALAGSVLYASDEENIYTINTSTGAATLVGATGLGFDDEGYGSILRDLASSSTALYGAQWTSSDTGFTGAVVTINPGTGAILSTAALSGLLETDANMGLYSIAYDQSTNLLYGNTAQRLYTIDPVTGATTLVGALPSGRIYGLDFDHATNTLFAINQFTDTAGALITNLLTLDTLNASILSATDIGNFCACDIAFDPFDNQGYISRSFTDGDGNFLYAGLDSLNPDLASTSFIGQHGPAATFGVNGLAFVGAPVPEPATWMMMIAGFGGIGFAMRRRNRQAAFA